MMNRDWKAFKSGIWYVFGAVFVKGIGYITTPIFARLMTQEDYGAYSNFSSWLSIITVFVTFDMYSTINRARYDYEGSYKCYISTITIFGVALPVLIYLFLLPLSKTIAMAMNLDMLSYQCIFLYSTVYSAFNIYQTRERVAYNYKHSVFLSMLISISTVALSIILCTTMENKYDARVIGQTVPFFIIGFMLMFTLLKVRCGAIQFKLEYIKYALGIALPFVPHLICAQLLTTSTRIEITNVLGNEQTAIFSIAQTCSFLVNLLSVSLNNAIAPWLGDSIHNGAYLDVQKKLKPVICIFCLMSTLICLFAPEIVYILGGAKYGSAVYLMPPIICGCLYQFIYTFYVNIETFEKKLWPMTFVTAVAAAICIAMNKILVSNCGLNAAPYAIMASFLVLLIGNYINVRVIGKKEVMDNKFVFIAVAVTTFLCLSSLLTYQCLVMRIAVIILLLAVLMKVLVKNAQALIKLRNKDT